MFDTTGNSNNLDLGGSLRKSEAFSIDSGGQNVGWDRPDPSSFWVASPFDIMGNGNNT